MQHPLIVLALLGISLYALYAFQRWRRSQPPAVVKKTTTRLLIYVTIALLVILVATGRLHWLIALIASAASALIPLFKRALPLLIRYFPMLAGFYRQAKAAKSRGAPSEGQTSTVATDTINMTLDHDSGDMDGEVLQGRFKGQRLSQLGLPDIIDILRECQQQDTESVPLLEAYLDRRFGNEWRESHQSDEGYQQSGAKTASDGAMAREEALAILGLSSDASEEDIVAAHRRLISKIHPDHGGSNYLATKINQAKSVLLKK